MTSSKYHSIADRLAAEIAQAVPGDRIAGEMEIARRFGAGRAAARSAVQELERRFLVRRVQGSGTYVNRRIDYVISRQRPPSWQQTVAAAGGRPRNVVRDVECLRAPTAVARRLDRPEGEPCHRLVRQSFIDDVPAAWAHEWVPLDLVRELGFAIHQVESLHLVVSEMASVEPVRTWCRVSLDSPPPPVMEGLGTDPSQLAWLVDSVTRDGEHGRPIWHTSSWMRCDAVRVIVEMGEESGQLDAPAAGTVDTLPPPRGAR